MADFKNKLPQEGTLTGESLGGPLGSSSPTYSEGGKNLLYSTVISGDTTVSKPDGHTHEKRISAVHLDRMSDSDCSLSARGTATSSRASSRNRAGSIAGKRRLPISESASDDGDSERSFHSIGSDTRRKKSTPSKRGRGRPPTTGEYIGPTTRNQKLRDMKHEDQRLQAEKEVADVLPKAQRRARRETRTMTERAALDELPTATKLKTVGEQGLELIKMVRMKNTNLEGTFTKALKEGEERVEESVRGLVSLREDTLRLEAENMRLRKELMQLRESVSQAHEVPLRPPVPTKEAPAPRNESEELTVTGLRNMFEEFSRSIMERTSNMVNARIEAMGDRLLPAKRIRPPLATDGNGSHLSQDWPVLPHPKSSTRTASPATTTTARAVGASTSVAAPTTEKKEKEKKKNIGKKKGEVKPAEQPPAPPKITTPGHSTAKEGWNVVASRKLKRIPEKVNPDVTKARTEGAPKAPQKPQPKKRTRRRRNAPASAAVVITLQHDAVERGISYKDVLFTARQGVNLSDLGLSEGVRIRQAVTGARIMELPKGVTSEVADRFAEKLRSVLAGTARIARPIKCSDIRVTGLDDTVTKEDVLAAIVTKTGCSPEHVKGGNVREGPGGTGTLWVKCPMAAANILVAAGRLLVGWSSARIHPLEPRAMNCYRCLEIGHTWQRCTSVVDRSGLCFRCCTAGHKASLCTAKPHCAVCADAGRASDHTVAGKGCAPPKKGRNWRRTNPQAAGRPNQARQELDMEVQNG